MAKKWKSEALRAKNWEDKIGKIDPRQIEELKKIGISNPERQIRLNSLLNSDNAKDDQIFDLLLDFNLDGMLSQGDVDQKSALQIKEVLSDLKISKADALNNLLAFVNKGKAEQITRENLTSIANFDEVHAILKNPAMDLKFILQYGANAAQKFLEAQPKISDAEALKNKWLVENNKELQCQIDNRLEQLKALQALRQNNKEDPNFPQTDLAKIENKISDEIK